MKNDKELALSLTEELFDLRDKIKKLDSFTKSSSFPALPDNEQSSLVEQLEVMIHYASILKYRLDILSNVTLYIEADEEEEK